MADKYPYHAQMYARMFLKNRILKGRKKTSVNYGFMGGDDAAVEEAAKLNKVTVKKFIEWADDYLDGGLGIVG